MCTFLFMPWWLNSLFAYLYHSKYNLGTEGELFPILILLAAVGGITIGTISISVSVRKGQQYLFSTQQH